MTRSMLYVLAMSAVLTVDAIAQVQSLTPAEMARYSLTRASQRMNSQNLSAER
ncbi:MAG: hypothetical protein ABIS29_20080 [Vicinamibacterales bacterium]